MTVTFVSNFINHHQVPLCTALYRVLGDDFTFIQTEPMTQQRLKDGWAVNEAMFSYVRFWYEEKALCARLIRESDIVIFGWSKLPKDLVQERLLSGAVTLRISERIYKEGRWKALSPRGCIAKYRDHIRHNRRPVYLLCADAYAAGDFALLGAYRGKRLRWGYFPETKGMMARTSDDAVDGDSGKTVRFCWAGRMIAWKHPEYALRLAKTMADRGADFTLDFIGDGPLREDLEAWTRTTGLQQQVIFHKTLRPLEVRHRMEQSNVFLFTSNYLEGWGAVVNEAMNSVCAVVASEEAGSVPYLITNGINGLTYRGGNYGEFEEQALRLLEDPALRKDLSRAAYDRIRMLWNAEEAAGRLLAFCEGALKGRPHPFTDDGPLSPAPSLKGASFFRTRQERMAQDHV